MAKLTLARLIVAMTSGATAGLISTVLHLDMCAAVAFGVLCGTTFGIAWVCLGES